MLRNDINLRRLKEETLGRSDVGRICAIEFRVETYESFPDVATLICDTVFTEHRRISK